MSSRATRYLVVALVASTLSALPALGGVEAADEAWQPVRNAYGQPDLEGVWSNNTATPLERPPQFGDKVALTDEELARLNGRLNEIREGSQAGDLLGDFLIQRVLEDPEFRGFDQDTGNYNSFWLVERELDRRTSLVIDPPDGRIPPMTPQARQRRAASYRGDETPDGPEDLPKNVRCISYGVPNTLAGYNSYFKIVQTRDYVVIYQELIHDARIIPLDDRPRLPEEERLWHGDSRGRWDGDGLVVETTNYSAQGAYRGASESLSVTERFERVAPDTIEWTITYDDPTTWERTWTMMIPLSRSDEKIFEYACHEANYSLRGILAGARLDDEESSSGR